MEYKNKPIWYVKFLLSGTVFSRSLALSRFAEIRQVIVVAFFSFHWTNISTTTASTEGQTLFDSNTSSEFRVSMRMRWQAIIFDIKTSIKKKRLKSIKLSGWRSEFMMDWNLRRHTTTEQQKERGKNEEAQIAEAQK